MLNFAHCQQIQPLTSRPRMYLASSKILFLKTKIQNEEEPYFTFFSSSIKKQADSYLNKDIPTPGEFALIYESKIRVYGNILPNMALTYLILEDSVYLNAIRDRMNALCSYPNWATNHDLGASHIMYGMSITFDWLYDSFTQTERNTYANKLFQQASIMHDVDMWWNDAYLQNHMYVNYAGIMSVAVTLKGETHASLNFIEGQLDNFTRTCYEKFGLILSSLQRDGASQEGVSYYTYQMEALLRYFSLEEVVFNEDRITDSIFMQKTGLYRLYSSTPAYDLVINYGDVPEHQDDYYGPSYILYYLATKFNDNLLQWLGNKVDEADIYKSKSPRRDWRTILWYDETITPISPHHLSLPTSKLFSDLGLFTSRSSWNDDYGSLFVTKIAPPNGHHPEKLLGIGQGGLGHVHPDEGAFHLYYNGEQMIIDNGYSYYKKTLSHNIITFGNDNRGQYGENSMWFKTSELRNEKGSCNIIKNEITNEYDYIVGNLTRIYPLDLKLYKYYRHMIFLKKRYLIIFDEITSNISHLINYHIHAQFKGNYKYNINNELIYTMENNNGNEIGFRIFDVSNINNKIEFGNYFYSITHEESGTTHEWKSTMLNITTNQERFNTKLSTIIIPFTNQTKQSSKYIRTYERSDGYLIIYFNNDVQISINTQKFHIIINEDLRIFTAILGIFMGIALIFIFLLVIIAVVIFSNRVIRFKRNLSIVKNDINESIEDNNNSKV